MELIRNRGEGRRLKRVIALAAAATAVALIVTGCAAGTPSSTSGSGSKGATITFIPKNLNNPYTGVELKGGKEASATLGFTYNAVGALDASADSQVPFIQTEVQNGTKVIAIAANDPNAVCSALNDARKGGAKVITFDSDTDPSCRDMFINQVDSKEVALGELKQLFAQIGGTGDIAILSATATATNQNAWIADMKAEMSTNPDYKWNLVDVVYGDDDDTKSFQQAQQLLANHPTLKGIISPTTVGIAATARYLSTSEFKGKVALVGLGLPPQMKPYVKDGTVTAFALWDPSDIGYLTTYAAKALLDGTITGKEGDTFDGGKLGKYTIGKDGLVVVGSLLEFNAQNIDQYDYITF
jgi:rhamnose transport system substrate-binding protein